MGNFTSKPMSSFKTKDIKEAFNNLQNHYSDKKFFSEVKHFSNESMVYFKIEREAAYFLTFFKLRGMSGCTNAEIFDLTLKDFHLSLLNSVNSNEDLKSVHPRQNDI